MAHVLVVEDDDSVRLVVTTALRDEGHQVVEAVEGEAALTLIDRHIPDIILIDLKMPGMDGWEFIRRYHERYQRDVPILVLTAATHGEARGFDAGADDVLEKPFDLDELDARIRRLLGPDRVPVRPPSPSHSSDLPAE